MPLESLDPGECRHLLDEPRRDAVRSSRHPRPDSQEVEDREPRGPPRRAPGREDVVRTRSVVAEDLRGRTEEDRAGVPESTRQSLGFAGRDLEVLGREPIRDQDQAILVLDPDHAAPHDRRSGDVPIRVGEILEAPFEGGPHAIRKSRVGRRQPDAGVRVVLGLGDQVRRHELRVGGLVGQHEQFARARESVDRDRSESRDLATGDERLRRGGEAVAGTHHEIARRSEESAGEGPDRLRASGGENPVAAPEPRRRESRVSRSRARHPDPLHAGHPRRDRRHQHARWQGIPTTRGVATHHLERHQVVSDLESGARYLHAEWLQAGSLGVRERADAFPRGLDGSTNFGGKSIDRGPAVVTITPRRTIGRITEARHELLEHRDATLRE